MEMLDAEGTWLSFEGHVCMRSLVSGEPRETQYLLQRLSVAVQWGNALAVLGCADFLIICFVFFFSLLLQTGKVEAFFFYQ